MLHAKNKKEKSELEEVYNVERKKNHYFGHNCQIEARKLDREQKKKKM